MSRSGVNGVLGALWIFSRTPRPCLHTLSNDIPGPLQDGAEPCGLPGEEKFSEPWRRGRGRGQVHPSHHPVFVQVVERDSGRECPGT